MKKFTKVTKKEITNRSKQLLMDIIDNTDEGPYYSVYDEYDDEAGIQIIMFAEVELSKLRKKWRVKGKR